MEKDNNQRNVALDVAEKFYDKWEKFETKKPKTSKVIEVSAKTVYVASYITLRVGAKVLMRIIFTLK